MMTTEQLQYLKKALAFVFSLVEPDEYFGKCPEADYEAINGLIEGEIERVSVKEIDLAIEVLKTFRPVRENRTTQPDGWVYELFYEAAELINEEVHDKCDYATYERLKEIMRELFGLIPKREL